MRTNSYLVSDTTAQFIDTLKSLEEFRESFFNALVKFYGEEAGAKAYEEHSELLSEVEKTVGSHFLCSVAENMGSVNFKDTI